MKRQLLAGCTCVAGLLFAGTAQGVIIDDFNDGPGSVGTDVPGPGPTNFEAATAVGGSRTLEIIGFPGDGDGLSQGAELEVAAPNPGAIGHSQDAFSPGGRSRVTWDDDGNGLGGVDLTDDGADNAFQLALLALDVGFVDVSFSVESNDHGTATIDIDDLEEGAFNVVYADFDGFSDEIFENVDKVTMTITAGEQSDLVIDIISTTFVPPIPEPTTAGLIVGLVSMGLIGRKRLPSH